MGFGDRHGIRGIRGRAWDLGTDRDSGTGMEFGDACGIRGQAWDSGTGFGDRRGMEFGAIIGRFLHRCFGAIVFPASD